MNNESYEKNIVNKFSKNNENLEKFCQYLPALPKFFKELKV